MSGLPRSGNTLLSCILNQNPDLHVSPNSPVSYLTYQLNRVIRMREEYIGYPKPNFVGDMIVSVVDNYYKDIDKKYIIDRSGTWGVMDNLQIAKDFINPKPKVICPVRNITDILTSFISLCDKNPDNFIDKRIVSPSNENRCEFLMKKGSMIDVCLDSYLSALFPDFENCFLFLEYDDIVFNTSQTLKNIYEFLDLDFYNHDLKNISSYDGYNDSIFGMPLHEVRSNIEKKSKNPKEVLGEKLFLKYSNLENWK